MFAAQNLFETEISAAALHRRLRELTTANGDFLSYLCFAAHYRPTAETKWPKQTDKDSGLERTLMVDSGRFS